MSEEIVNAAGEENVLTGGVEILNEMKAGVLELDELKVRVSELTEKQAQLEKDIAAKQKAMEAEISSTSSKRIAEIEKTYDDQVEKTRSSIKEVKGRRDKLKGTKVEERVSYETAELNEELRSLKQDLKGVFSRHHIPRLYNNEYFFTMFMPDGIGDFLIILLTIIILLALPVGIYFLLPETLHKIIWLVVLYAVIILIGLGIYTLLFKCVYKKNDEALKEAKAIRDNIAVKKKRIARKEKKIRKDKDESSYGLEKFDSELADLDLQIDDVIKEKKQALKTFESQTKKVITDEISARYQNELSQLKAESESAYAEQRGAEARIKDKTLEMSNRYASFVGKENLTVPMIDSLIEIISSGDALNIADAIVYYKKNQAEAKKES